ncbi:MAG: rubrerythrin family protein [bacterium]|nr:rubrerythrin family protein [bacterium]
MSKTKENLEAAFAGESMARNKYTYFAKVARKEGYHYIGNLFEETADNEMEHAKEHFKKLNGIGDTKANLKAAVDGEHYETTEMYPNFAKIAEEEGEKEAARVFKMIGKVESHHEARYQRLLDMVEKGTVYKRETAIRWKCSKCGHIHIGTEPPGKCPTCLHPLEYFEPECMCFEDDCVKCS